MEKFDEKKYELIFHSHFREMVVFAMHYVRDKETATDVVQQVFVNLWEKRKHIDAAGNVRSYLFNAVKNRSLNYLRDHKKYHRDLLKLEEEAFAEESDTELEARELSRKINLAIEELPPRCREIFKLSRHESMKYREIAEKLNISVKTVENQMSKAIDHLRQHLKEYLMILLFVLSSTQSLLAGGPQKNEKEFSAVEDRGKTGSGCIIFDKE